MESKTKLGLVLSGGGAKGAYEVGVIRALAELGIEPEVISGASVGALNGAFVSAAPSMSDAALQLEALWCGLNNDNMLKLRQSSAHYIGIAALHNSLAAIIESVPHKVTQLLSFVQPMFSEEDRHYLHLLDSSPLEDIIRESLNFDILLSSQSRDLYVSVYPATSINDEIKKISSTIAIASELYELVNDLIRYAKSYLII